MNTQVLRGLAAFVLFLSLGYTTLAAHPGHEHKLMGTVASIDGSRLVVKPGDGPEKAVEIVSTTKFLRGKKRGMVQELKVGMRVVVNIGDGKEPLKAKEIQYPDTPTTQH